MNSSDCQSILQGSHENGAVGIGNTPEQAGQDYANALAAMWATAMGPQGASVVPASTQAAASTMASQIASAFTAKGDSFTTANQIYQAVIQGVAILILAGGTYGAHISCVPGPTFASDLANIWDSQLPTAQLVAQQESLLFLNWSKQIIANGTGTPPATPPAVGNLT